MTKGAGIFAGEGGVCGQRGPVLTALASSLHDEDDPGSDINWLLLQVRVGFKGSEDLWVDDVLNIGVDPR